ncbi:hypothetical protein C8Q77DRAFT_1156823 [Trametes polyzona]|nr:hypothetical protein C8Q77DRAFT_1156823 [Trametes polyzona]
MDADFNDQVQKQEAMKMGAEHSEGSIDSAALEVQDDGAAGQATNETQSNPLAAALAGINPHAAIHAVGAVNGVVTPSIPSHEWSTARYPATTRQLNTLRSLSVAQGIDLPFLQDPEHQINRAGASRLIQFLIRGERPSEAVVNHIFAEGVDPEPTGPFVFPNGDAELRTERQAQYIGMLYARLHETPRALDNLTQNEASAMIRHLRARFEVLRGLFPRRYNGHL